MPVKSSGAIKCIIMRDNKSTLSESQSARNCFVFYVIRSDHPFLSLLLIFTVLLMVEILQDEEERKELFQAWEQTTDINNNLCSLSLCA